MMHRWCFEALDRSLRDIMSYDGVDNSNKPFGGISVVLGGDFRHILLVIRKGCRQDIVAATINSSKLWDHCKVLELTTNMRLTASTAPTEQLEIKTFAEWILSIGNGNGSANESGEIILNIPDDLLIKDSTDPLRSLIDFVYPDFLENMKKFFKSVVYLPQIWMQSSMLMIIFYCWSPEVSKNIIAVIRFVNRMQIVRYTVNGSQPNS